MALTLVPRHAVGTDDDDIFADDLLVVCHEALFAHDGVDCRGGCAETVLVRAQLRFVEGGMQRAFPS